MTTAANTKPTSPTGSPDDHPWKIPARRTAWVAGVYCAIVAVVLLVNFFRSRAADPINNPELTRLKAELARDPVNESLKQQIRALDRRLREQYLGYLKMAGQSGWMLFGGVLALLPALHYATWRKRLPRRGKYVANPEKYDQDAAHSRWAVAGLAALLAGAGWWVAHSTETHLDAALNLSAKPPASLLPAVDTSIPAAEEIARYWPRFRGPQGSGISTFTNTPMLWNRASGDGVLWKSPTPLSSPNSPVVWSNRVFLTGGDSARREVYCYDADTGKLLWQQPVGKAGKPLPKEDEEGHYFATSTGATDGRRFYAIFETGDVVAFDYQGQAVWARNLGKPDNHYGYSTSLEVYKNLLIIQFDEGDEDSNKSRILALNTATGQEVWRTAPRPVGATWSTPIVISAAGREQLIACGNPWLISYNPADGKEWWRAKIGNGEITPSPVFGAGFVITANETLYATKPDGHGDVTKTHVAWKAEDGIPDICSPLCDGQQVYLMTSSGIFTAYNVQTGAKVYEKELELEFKASPSLANGRLYLMSEKGAMVIAQAGPEFKELARNEIGEESQASPAFTDGRIYLRGKKHLFCLGNKQ